MRTTKLSLMTFDKLFTEQHCTISTLNFFFFFFLPKLFLFLFFFRLCVWWCSPLFLPPTSSFPWASLWLRGFSTCPAWVSVSWWLMASRLSRTKGEWFCKITVHLKTNRQKCNLSVMQTNKNRFLQPLWTMENQKTYLFSFHFSRHSCHQTFSVNWLYFVEFCLVGFEAPWVSDSCS